MLWRASSRRQHQLPVVSVGLNADVVDAPNFVGDLGIYLDADDLMTTYVAKTVSACLRSPSTDPPYSTLGHSANNEVTDSGDGPKKVASTMATQAGPPNRPLPAVHHGCCRTIGLLRTTVGSQYAALRVDLHWLRIYVSELISTCPC